MRLIVLFLLSISELVIGKKVFPIPYTDIEENILSRQTLAHSDFHSSSPTPTNFTKMTHTAQQPATRTDSLFKENDFSESHSGRPSKSRSNAQSDLSKKAKRQRTGEKDISLLIEKELLSLSKPFAHYFDGMNLDMTRYFHTKLATRDLMRTVFKGSNIERINREILESLKVFVSSFKVLDLEALSKCKKIHAQPNMCFYFSFKDYAKEIEGIEFVSREILWNSSEKTPDFELPDVMCEKFAGEMSSRFSELQESAPLWMYEPDYMKVQRSAEVAEENLTQWREICEKVSNQKFEVRFDGFVANK